MQVVVAAESGAPLRDDLARGAREGRSLREIQQPFIILAIFAAVVFTLAVRQYSKRVA